MSEVIVMKSWKWMAVLMMLGAALAVGCGGDDDDDDKATGSAGKGSAGKGSSEAGASGSPDTMEVPDGGVPCGNQVCMPQEGSTVTLCCADPFSAKCGMMQGQSCVARVVTDPRCPSIMAGGGMFILASCCTDDNMCGIDTSVFNGNPCTELGMAASQAMMMGGGMFITFPPPKSCDE
jgi:hypothetical protein